MAAREVHLVDEANVPGTVGALRYGSGVAAGEVTELVADSGNPRNGAATSTARAGAQWSIDECTLVVDKLRAGAAVGDIAAQLERTPGAIKARLCRMIPRELNVHRDGAAGWLLSRFAADPDYDWRGVMAGPTREHRKVNSAQDALLSGLPEVMSVTRPS
jgi:hypothetical protein